MENSYQVEFPSTMLLITKLGVIEHNSILVTYSYNYGYLSIAT